MYSTEMRTSSLMIVRFISEQLIINKSGRTIIEIWMMLLYFVIMQKEFTGKIHDFVHKEKEGRLQKSEEEF